MGSFKLKLVLYFALLALLPLAVTFYGFDQLAKRSETRRVDARLQGGLRASLSNYGDRLSAAQQEAAQLGRDQALQRAIRAGDRAAIAARLAGHPLASVRTSRFTVGARPPLSATRAVSVVGDRGAELARISVAVPTTNRLLSRLGSGLGGSDELVAIRDGRIVAGLHRGARVSVVPGRASRVTVGNRDYRALAAAPLRESPAVAFAALGRQHAIDAAAAASVRRLFLGIAATLILLGLVTYLLGRSIVRTLSQLAAAANGLAGGRLGERVDVGGRDEFAQLAVAFNSMAEQLEDRLVELDAERRRLREQTGRFGDALAATHDTEQLLRIVVETAVEATGAYGGVVVTPQRELARAGDPESGVQTIELPLTAGRRTFGKLVLSGPSFDAEQRETAAFLARHAVVALENARLHRIVERQANVDELTGLANRRSVEQTLLTELARAERFRGDMCLVLADLDDFKTVNDRFGHPFGDLVLREFAHALGETVREIDTAGRWGGEEFALILPGTDAEGGAALAERARASIASRELRTPSGTPVTVTSSFGVAAFPENADVRALVAAADAALYEAKRAGKDRVVIAPEPVRG